jgi:hypothetical protein
MPDFETVEQINAEAGEQGTEGREGGQLATALHFQPCNSASALCLSLSLSLEREREGVPRL